MFEIPAFLSYLPPDKKCTFSQLYGVPPPPLDAIQKLKSIADCYD